LSWLRQYGLHARYSNEEKKEIMWNLKHGHRQGDGEGSAIMMWSLAEVTTERCITNQPAIAF
jgi:hypothetical protein